MSQDVSVSKWIGRLKLGDEQAAERLWQQFFSRLLGLAYKKLSSGARRVADEEDVVLSTFKTVFYRIQAGQYPQLHDRDDLWQLLVAVAECKAINQIRDQHRLKRGGGQVKGESAWMAAGDPDDALGIGNVPSQEPTPELVAMMDEAVEGLLVKLDSEQRTIALMKLEGHSNEEIAEKINRSLPTVERRLRLIRTKWQTDIK